MQIAPANADASVGPSGYFLISQHLKDIIQCLQFFRLIEESFQILLELAGIPQLFNNPIDLSIASTLEVSIRPSSLPALASSKAAFVISLGSWYTASKSMPST